MNCDTQPTFNGIAINIDSTGATGDKTYTQAFPVGTSVTITHNLGKYPAIQLFDSTNRQFEGDDIVHIDLNTAFASWLGLTSGYATAN